MATTRCRCGGVLVKHGPYWIHILTGSKFCIKKGFIGQKAVPA
jgi:hypothetical protein